MIKSEQIGTLLKALAAAKKELPAVSKDGWNPFTKSKYTTLEHLLPVCDPILAKHGLFVVHLIGTGAEGPEVTVLLIMPEAAEYMGESAIYPAEKKNAQAWGSAITYGRRYSYVAILGIATAEGDDDGRRASEGGNSNGKETAFIDEEQAKTLLVAVNDAGADIAKVCAYFNVTALDNLPFDKFDVAMDTLTEFKKSHKAKK